MTGFRIGVGRNQWIVTTCTSKRSYLAVDGVRTLVTSVEAVSAGGAVIEEMLIVPGKTYGELVSHVQLPSGTLLAPWRRNN